MLEPVASDAVFVASEPDRIHGDFSGPPLPGRFFRRSYLTEDKTGSLANPFHNFEACVTTRSPQLPEVPPDALRASAQTYPQTLRNTYLQLPQLDPRIAALAKTHHRPSPQPV